MNIVNEIRLAMAVRSGVREFYREQYKATRNDRAAGRNISNNGSTTEPVNITSEPQKTTTPVVEKPKTQKPNNPKQKAKAEKPKQQKSVKTEQEIKAESEAPVEPAGAEKINANVESYNEAAMGSQVGVQDNSGVLDFSAFGVTIDTSAMNGNPNPANVFNQPNAQPKQISRFNPAFYEDTSVVPGLVPPEMVAQDPNYAPVTVFQQNVVPNVDPNAQRPAPMHPQTIMVPQNIPSMAPPVAGVIPMSQADIIKQVNNPTAPPPNQPKPQKPKPQKSEPDKVDMAGMPDLKNGMEIVDNPKKDVRTIGVVTSKLDKNVEPVEESIGVKSKFAKSNEPAIAVYPYLREVEAVANQNGYQMAFTVQPNNMIACYVGNADGICIPNKGFMIDPGNIIDHQKKIYPGITNTFEDINPFNLFPRVENNNNGKKGKGALNVDILTALIVGGNDAVAGKKGLYTPPFLETNKYCALITIPTKSINQKDRKFIQGRLVELYKDGTFRNALASNPHGRFRIADFNPHTNTMILDTDGTPKNYGHPYVSGERIQLRVTADKAKICRGSNIIPIMDHDQQVE